MGWRDLFRDKSAPKREEQQCSFCRRPRAEVHALVAGDGVSICDDCIVLAAAACGETSGDRLLARIVAEIAASYRGTRPERVVEPLTRAACALCGDDPDAMRALAGMLHARDGAAFSRATLIACDTIGAERLTQDDVDRLVTAALLVGDFDRAERARPADATAAAAPLARLDAVFVKLLRARPGDPELDALAAQARELARTLPGTDGDSEEARGLRGARDMLLALAELRAGRPASALAQLLPYREHPGLRPWHLLVLGDAFEASGDGTAARAAWQRVAETAAWEPYWCEEARGRLARGGSPYR